MMIPDQTEAERQASEKADAEKAAADKRTAMADDRFNRILRGEPSDEEQQAKNQIKDKTRQRLEAIAADDSDPDDQAWAQGLLDSKTDLNGKPIKPKPAKPGAGESSFNSRLRRAAGRGS